MSEFNNLLENRRKPPKRSKTKILVFFVIFVFLVLGVVFEQKVKNWLKQILEWIKENPYKGPFVLSFLYIILTILMFPASILTLGAGFAFQ